MRIALVHFFSVQNIKIKIQLQKISKIQIHEIQIQIKKIHKNQNQTVVVLVAYYNSLFNQFKIYETHIFTHKKSQNRNESKFRRCHQYRKNRYPMKPQISDFAVI